MSAIDWYEIALLAAVPFLVTFFAIPRQINYMKKIGWIGRDIHKKSRPEVAESGGISLLFGVSSGFILLMILRPEMFIEFLAAFTSTVLAALIGLIDDKLRLSAIKKIASVIFATIPMVLLYWGTSHISGTPVVPFLGFLQVTLLYLPFIPGLLAVLMNVVNMLEGYNGEGSGTSIVVAISMILCSIILGSTDGIIMILPVLASTIAFFYYNKYPAKIFPGDIGTLQLGMVLGCIAIISGLEFVLLVSMIPQILHAFHVIRSVGGFKESATFKIKDIEMIDGDLIKASSSKDAPLTLPRIIVARKPLSEPELVKNIIFFNIVSAFLSVLSAFLIQATFNGDFVLFSFIFIVIAGVSCLVIALLFPAIRVLNLIIIAIFVAIIGILVFIDRFVVGLGLFNWLVAGVISLVALAAWYVLSLKYFMHITTREPIKKA
ncbi:MAG: hypothetical protein ACFFCS_07795 [Candidatus Hodarchaeota archaeon]